MSSVVGRAELLSAIFVLLSLNFYCETCLQQKQLAKPIDNRKVAIVLLFTIGGMLCKEQAITIIPICIAFECCFNRFDLKSIKLNDSLTIKSLLFSFWKSSSSKIQTKVHIQMLISGLIVIVGIRWRVMNCSLPKFSRYDFVFYDSIKIIK